MMRHIGLGAVLATALVAALATIGALVAVVVFSPPGHAAITSPGVHTSWQAQTDVVSADNTYCNAYAHERAITHRWAKAPSLERLSELAEAARGTDHELARFADRLSRYLAPWYGQRPDLRALHRIRGASLLVWLACNPDL